jgi:hypothetical protein
MFAFRRGSPAKRGLGAVTMLGLWFVAKPLFVATLAAGAIVLVWPLLARLGKTTKRVTLGLGLLAAVAIGVPMLLVVKSEHAATAVAAAPGGYAFSSNDATKTADETNLPAQAADGDLRKQQATAQRITFAAQLAHAGVLDGVRPVALTMPSYTQSAYASRQLVTPSNAFTPVVWYVTDTGLALLALLWIASAAALAWLSRDRLVALRDAVRAALAPKSSEMAEQKA